MPCRNVSAERGTHIENRDQIHMPRRENTLELGLGVFIARLAAFEFHSAYCERDFLVHFNI